MKIYDSNTQETYDINEFALKCRTFSLSLQSTAEYCTPKMAFKCGVIAADAGKLISTVYSLESQLSHYDKKYLRTSLEILSEILDIEVTEDTLRTLIEECVEKFLNEEYIHVIEYTEKRS